MNRKFFLALAYQRLADGRDEYGNQSVALSFDALTDEIEQEILDVWAWAEMAGLKAVAERRPDEVKLFEDFQEWAYEGWVKFFCGDGNDG